MSVFGVKFDIFEGNPTYIMSLFEIRVPQHLKLDITIKTESSEDLKQLRELLTNINTKIDKLMSNTDQALADLQVIGQTLTKVSTETSTLLQKITDLENATTPDTPQSVLDAIAAVRTQAEAIDNLVPDAPATTEPTA